MLGLSSGIDSSGVSEGPLKVLDKHPTCHVPIARLPDSRSNFQLPIHVHRCMCNCSLQVTGLICEWENCGQNLALQLQTCNIFYFPYQGIQSVHSPETETTRHTKNILNTAFADRLHRMIDLEWFQRFKMALTLIRSSISTDKYQF